jgi:hypothetical protein
MAKNKKDVPIKLRNSWLKDWKEKENNGQYEAFIRTFDISSTGIKSRYPCPYTPGRFYQTLSINELFQLIHLLKDPTIKCIKEQYAVVDRKKNSITLTDESVALAMEMNIKHPTYPQCDTPIVITWDFLCETISGGMKVFSVKPAYVLGKKRVKQLIALERALAIAHGYEYELIVDTKLKTIQTDNYVKASFGAKLPQELRCIYKAWFPNFADSLSENEYESLLVSIKKAGKQMGIGLQHAYKLALHAFWIGDVSSSPRLALLPEISPYELEVEVHA